METALGGSWPLMLCATVVLVDQAVVGAAAVAAWSVEPWNTSLYMYLAFLTCILSFLT